MKRLILFLLVIVNVVLTAVAQSADYKIILERDTTVKTRAGGVTLSTRAVRRYVYEYPSKDADGKPVTISGVIMIPSNIVDGSAPCDGILLFNRATLGSPEDAPSTGNSELINGLIVNPLKPNYILIMSDFIGYGSSIDKPSFYHSGDVNARNSLDGLVAARKLLTDKQIPMGKYLFNLGFSQGGSETLYVAKLRDMEYKDKGITITKTFAGGGPTDYVIAYKEYVKRDWCEDCKDVVMMLISAVENLHLNIDYKDLFKEPLATGAKEYVKTKKKETLGDYGVSMQDSLHNLIQPAYMDVESDQAKAFMAALEKINLMKDWDIDTTQRYFIEHSRHDNYVPIQCVRAIIPWMREKGFTPSLVPGKTNLQTNTLVFKANHSVSAIIWLIQTVAAIEVWPVAPQLVASHRANRSGALAAIMDFIPGIKDALAKVDLTPEDAEEMLEDAGITLEDVLQVAAYLFLSPSSAPETDSVLSIYPFSEDVEAPVQLFQLYEQTLANWYMQGGINVEYEKWGW